MKKELIFEELSVSDEVNNVGNFVISDILDEIQNDIGTYYQHGVLRKQCDLYHTKPLFGLVVKNSY